MATRMLTAARGATRRGVGALDQFSRTEVANLPGIHQLVAGLNNRAVPMVTRLLYRPGPQEVNGIRMVIPRPDRWGGGGEFHMAVGSYERRELDCILRHIDAGDCFVDVGAHIGYFSLPIARAVGPSGRVVAIEPTPTSASLLRRNVELNDFGWIDVIEAAASDRSGRGQLITSATSAMWNTLEPDTLAGETSTQDVETRTIDELLDAAGWPRVTWLKMDVEGHEQGVIAGCGRTLERYPALRIMFEVSGGSEDRVAASLRTLSAFEDLGFTFEAVEDALHDRGALMDSGAIRDRLTGGSRWQDWLFNVVAQRPRKVSSGASDR